MAIHIRVVKGKHCPQCHKEIHIFWSSRFAAMRRCCLIIKIPRFAPSCCGVLPKHSHGEQILHSDPISKRLFYVLPTIFFLFKKNGLRIQWYSSRRLRLSSHIFASPSVVNDAFIAVAIELTSLPITFTIQIYFVYYIVTGDMKEFNTMLVAEVLAINN